MVFYQKRFSNQISIDFRNDHIHYSIKDSGSKGNFKIPYEQITNEVNEYYEKNLALRTYSIYLLVMGIVFTVGNVMFEARLLNGLFFLASLVLFIIYKVTQSNYSIIQTNEKKIYVLKDKQHNQILSTLFKTRNDYLKQTYGAPDFSNDYHQEIRRFSWLYSLGVISEIEYKSIQSEFEKFSNITEPDVHEFHSTLN